MVRRVALLLSLMIPAALACQRDVRSLRFTEHNQDAVLQRVLSTRALTPKDKALVQGYLVRCSMPDGAGGKSTSGERLSPVGKTVQEILEAQRTWVIAEGQKLEKERQENEHQENERQNRALTQERARQQMVRSALSVRLVSVDVTERKKMVGVENGWVKYRTNLYLRLNLRCENKGLRDILAYTGTFTVRDVFGDLVGFFALDVSETLRVGQTRDDGGEWEIRSYDSNTKNRILAGPELTWHLDRIAFPDESLVFDELRESDVPKEREKHPNEKAIRDALSATITLGQSGTFTIHYANRSGKDIRALICQVCFRDVFGKELGYYSFEDVAPLGAGQSRDHQGHLDDIGALDAEHLRVEWEPICIVFKDGQTLDHESK